MSEFYGNDMGLASWCFHLENIGCIESGEICVKPLTLLCGPNNTGKTWAMYALYGFLKNCIGNSPPSLPGLNELVDGLRERGICAWNFGEWLEKHASELIELINRGVRENLPNIFNAPDGLFINSRFDWDIKPEDLVQSALRRRMEFRHILGRDRNEVLSLLKLEREWEVQITFREEKIVDLESWLAHDLLSHLMNVPNLLLGNQDQGSRSRVFLMPAERNGLHLFRRELASRRIRIFHSSPRRMSEVIQEDVRASYTKPIADYIDWLNDIPDIRKSSNEVCQQSVEHIKRIVEGGYDVDTDGNISFAPKTKPKNKRNSPKLELNLASSTVKSLFGLWFYLRYEAKLGDTLMIDEPELNLHPDNQRKLAKMLVGLVNSGVRVVTSTHSDYIVREINNLVMLHTPFRGRDALARRFKYKADDFIASEKVAAYLFDGNGIKAMEVKPEEGIIADTFDQVIADLNQSSNDIFYTKRDSVK